ncbi:hypothetical protein AB6A40_010689 [Gnathostoma spinigerum]|uniref:Uncharacterized protein n=1 Tax=Gnathostoma spinigerum TaxID=75299 RepID=A0ABD6EWX9_9BILA
MLEEESHLSTTLQAVRSSKGHSVSQSEYPSFNSEAVAFYNEIGLWYDPSSSLSFAEDEEIILTKWDDMGYPKQSASKTSRKSSLSFLEANIINNVDVTKMRKIAAEWISQNRGGLFNNGHRQFTRVKHSNNAIRKAKGGRPRKYGRNEMLGILKYICHHRCLRLSFDTVRMLRRFGLYNPNCYIQFDHNEFPVYVCL